MAVTLHAQPQKALQVKELKLKNGMTVWLNEDHSQPKVYGAVVVKAGAKDCPGTGIAHYFEHIMFKGTDRIGTIDYEAERPWLDSISAQYDLLSQTQATVSNGLTQKEIDARRAAIQKHINELSVKAADYAIPNEFNRLISRFGGSGLNAATGLDVTFYHNTFLPQYINQWCWLNSERLLKPVFRLFQAELENVYEEKNRSADEMGDALEKALTAIFKDQPYGQPIIGTTDNLKNPRLSDMEAFYKKYYVASNMGLILCGDIQADSLQTLLEQTFGRVQTGPVPERVKSPMPPTGRGEQVGIKLPIPLIKILAQVSNAPTDFDADADALDLANSLLTNGKAGFLDSLMNEHQMMMGMAARTAFNDAGLQFLAVVPNLPFGKKQKAADLCRRQMERVKQGDFSDERLEELKREMLLEAEQALETIDGRAAVMLDAMSQGQSWQAVLSKIDNLKRIGRDDVIRVARKYYTDDFLTLKKEFGLGDKETLKQPGYKPVEPKQAGAKSAYARELEQMPVANSAIRTIDFDRDVITQHLSPTTTLYAKANPMNDIFTFTLRYLDGKHHTPVLAQLADYLSDVGTDSLKKQQLETAWLRLGVTMDVKAADDYFTFTLTGRDAQLKPALQLLAHFLGHAAADKEALKEMRQAAKVNNRSFGKQKDDVLRAMLQWKLYGQQSDYLRQLSLKEVKALTCDDLLAQLRSLQDYACELDYCGRLPISEVAAMAQQALPLARCSKPQIDTYRAISGLSGTSGTSGVSGISGSSEVYFYHVKKSRQNYIVSLEQIGTAPTWKERVVASLWNRYMGGGMSSVLFQNVREFRSLAYSTQGVMRQPDMARHANDPLAYVTVTGTQADKSLTAMHTVDSLLRQMPVNEENIEAARQEMLSDVQNDYPTFREVARHIADQRRKGYESNPDLHTVELAPAVTTAEVEQFHRQHVAQNKRVWVVIGDRKQTDFKALEAYGKVTEIKKEEIFR